MVNPDISLFHPVPEGALTYQPNPNSIVQAGPWPACVEYLSDQSTCTAASTCL